MSAINHPNAVNGRELISAAHYAIALDACMRKRTSVQGIRNDLTHSLVALAAYDEHRRWTPQQLVEVEALAEHVLESVRAIRAEEAYGGRHVQ